VHPHRFASGCLVDHWERHIHPLQSHAFVLCTFRSWFLAFITSQDNFFLLLKDLDEFCLKDCPSAQRCVGDVSRIVKNTFHFPVVHKQDAMGDLWLELVALHPIAFNIGALDFCTICIRSARNDVIHSKAVPVIPKSASSFPN